MPPALKADELNWTKVLTGLFVAFFCLCANPQLASAERVKDVHQIVSLGQNGQLSVTETDTVDFGKAGIGPFVRNVATLYKRSGKICSVGVYVKQVLDGSGKPLRFITRNVQGYQSILIGDNHTAMSGVHVFKLNYEVINSVNFVSGQPELFYSALGHEWPAAIDKANVALTLSGSQSNFANRAVAYVGSFGSKRRAHAKYNGGVLSIGAEKLAAGQDLLVVMPLPSAAVARSPLPDALNEIYLTSKLAVILPVGTFVMLFLLWLMIGSDQRFGKAPDFTLGAPWQPPRELTPAELGTVMDETCDDEDIIATIFDLASRGYLAVRETLQHGAIGYGTKDYEFSQPAQPVAGILKAHEDLLINVIFTGRNKSYLSDMRGYFYDYMSIFRKQIFSTLVKDKFFARNPQTDRSLFTNTAACVLALGAGLFAYSEFITATYKVISYGVIASGVLIFFAAGVMPKRTRKGVAVIEQSHLFEHFILHAPDEDLEAALEHDPTIFYRLLPYTLVLGMAEFWAARFKHLVKEYPPWYTSLEQVEGDSAPFDLELLVKEIVASVRAIDRAATTRPEQKHGQTPSTGSSRNLP